MLKQSVSTRLWQTSLSEGSDMATIEVNHRKLRDAASAVRDHCAQQDKQMKRADTDVKAMLTTDWTGQDAMEFGGKWEGVDGKDSVAVKLKDSLETYSDALDACADAYQRAQEDAYSRASRLPKIFT